MIKGLVITPVVIGRISIGERVESNGKQLPKKSDEFHITSNMQHNGQWVVPKSIEEAKTKEGKLHSIPVRIMFDSPDNNFRSGYACFNNDGRQVCAGNGETASRMTPQGREDVECPGHEMCKFGQANRCKPYARLMIALESIFEKDPLAAFAFRTTGYNSVNALTSRLTQFSALTGGKLSGMACNLVLRPKSTAKSRRQAIYYVDLEPRGSLFDAVAATHKWHLDCQERNINLEALDKAVAAGFDAMPYIDSDETMQEEDVAGEFFPEPPPEDEQQQPSGQQNSARQETIRNEQTSTSHERSQATHQERSQGGVHDLLGDAAPNTGESDALRQVLTRINGLADPKAIPAAQVWVNNHPDLANEIERERARQALMAKAKELSPDLPQAA